MPSESTRSSERAYIRPDAEPVYTPRRPEQTVLYRTICEQLESFLARSHLRRHPVPRFVAQELHAFLRCGVLAHGFLRLHCDACGHDRLVPFSCKRRGFCPACGGRRMADTAAHLVDRVLPEVPIRQWVLTLPYPLRYRCAYDPTLASAVLRAFVRALFAEMRRRARHNGGTLSTQCGAVTFVQRFGSALNLNLHFHTLALDGVYADAGHPAEAPRFLPLPPPDDDAVARVLAGTARRIHRLVAERAGGEEDALSREEPLLALLAAASLRGRSTSGLNAGERWRRLGDRVDPAGEYDDPEASPSLPQHGGMSLHAAVAVPARDRRRLERLCRYVARPPLANNRLEEHPDGRLALRLKTRWRDGTTHILMERSELLDRLVPLIPPPRAHLVRYHGILAPCASLRDRIVPGRTSAVVVATPRPAANRAVEHSSPGLRCAEPGRPENPLEVEPSNLRAEPSAATPVIPAHQPTPEIELRNIPPDSAHSRRYRWAALLKRVFEVDALQCPRCGSTLRLIAAIEHPNIARRILECLKLPARAPPLEPAPEIDDFADPATAQQESAWDFDQTPTYEEPELP